MSDDTPPQHVDLASCIGTKIAKRLMPVLGEFGQEFLASVPVCEYHVRVVFDARQQQLVIVDHTETHIPPDVDTLVLFGDGTISSESAVAWRQEQGQPAPAAQPDWELPEEPEPDPEPELDAAQFARFQAFQAREASAAAKAAATAAAPPRKKAVRKKKPKRVQRPQLLDD